MPCYTLALLRIIGRLVVKRESNPRHGHSGVKWCRIAVFAGLFQCSAVSLLHKLHWLWHPFTKSKTRRFGLFNSLTPTAHGATNPPASGRTIPAKPSRHAPCGRNLKPKNSIALPARSPAAIGIPGCRNTWNGTAKARSLWSVILMRGNGWRSGCKKSTTIRPAPSPTATPLNTGLAHELQEKDRQNGWAQHGDYGIENFLP